MLFDHEASERLFNHVLELWVNPEIKRRIKAGSIDYNYVIRQIQIIILPDKQPIIRFNQELQGKALVKLKEGVTKTPGENVHAHEIESTFEFILKDNEENYGHLTMLLIGNGQWSIVFDFRMNKVIARDKYDAGLEFLETSKICKEKGFFYVAIDSLFSALELFVTSQLIVQSEQKYATNQSHQWTRSKYFAYISSGNDKPEFRNLYNELYKLRDKARYKNTPIDDSIKKKFEECLIIVEEVREYAKNHIT